MSNDLEIIKETEKWCANNYSPMPVVLEKGEDVWVYDTDGKRYLDMISSFSSLNQGHRHPKIINALIEQAGKITITSRAYHNNILGKFLKKLCELTAYEKVLPMNTGAEAVETALKLSRKWGAVVKGIPDDRSEIIVCSNNFHGRTTTIVSFSSEAQYKNDFGALSPGFKLIPFGDIEALENAITPNTIAFLTEPIQGEGGIIVPPDGYLAKARELTQKNNMLLVVDEIQTGFGRTGKLFAHMYENIVPDILIVGKSLGGGVYPVSAILSTEKIMGVFKPGDHGSTFGGNPLAAAVGIASLDVLVDENLIQNSYEMGKYFFENLVKINSPKVKEVRGKGLMIGVEIQETAGKARSYCDKLIERGVLCKDTHGQVIRFSPPLTLKKEHLDFALENIRAVL